VKSPTPWVTAGAATGREEPSKAAVAVAGTANASAAGAAARTSAGATGACATCPPFVPQHSRPMCLQAARSAALIGQAEEKHTGAPRKAIRSAATVSAAEARRKLFTGSFYQDQGAPAISSNPHLAKLQSPPGGLHASCIEL